MPPSGGAGSGDALCLTGNAGCRVQEAFANRFRDTRAVEAAERQQLRGVAVIDELVREAHLTVEPVTEAQARIARDAYRDFGKGSGHPAQLNFGDCFAYALAKTTGEPLLFKGDDFTHTDITPVRT